MLGLCVELRQEMHDCMTTDEKLELIHDVSTRLMLSYKHISDAFKDDVKSREVITHFLMHVDDRNGQPEILEFIDNEYGSVDHMINALTSVIQTMHC